MFLPVLLYQLFAELPVYQIIFLFMVVLLKSIGEEKNTYPQKRED